VGAIAGGYFVEAAIPWRVPGLQPRPGLKLRGDLGVLFADSSGTVTVSRQFWSNKATGLVNDIPGEAELTPNSGARSSWRDGSGAESAPPIVRPALDRRAGLPGESDRAWP
jgi:hypothetical protein